GRAASRAASSSCSYGIGNSQQKALTSLAPSASEGRVAVAPRWRSGLVKLVSSLLLQLGNPHRRRAAGDDAGELVELQVLQVPVQFALLEQFAVVALGLDLAVVQ